MSITKLPPPRRFCVSENENGIPYLVEVTGSEDPVYIVGLESPWAGSPLEQIETWMNEGAYGENTRNLKTQIKGAKEGDTFFEKEDDEPL